MWFMKFKSMRGFFVSIFFPFGKTLAVMMDRDDDNENCYESNNVSFCSSISKSRLLRTSTSSPYWITETLVPVLEVVADVLVLVHSLRGWKLLGCKSRASGRK